MGEGSDALMRDEDDTTTYGSGTAADRANGDGAVTPQTVEIRANIEQTRAEMSETIEAIQERLSPQHLKEQVKGQVREQFEEVKSSVRDATIGKAETMVRSASDSVTEARYTLMETIRQNPIPAAMVGLGLGWLLMNRRSTPSYRAPRYEQQGYRGAGYYDAGAYAPGEAYRGYGRAEAYYEEPHQGIATQGRQAVRSTVNRVQETAGDVAGRAQETASNVAGRVQETVGDVAERAQETASTLAARTQYQATRLEDRFQSALYENPLAVGAIALAVGAAVGLATPGTERENQLLGEARDNLVERAQEVAHETVEKLQHVAEQVVGEVQTTTQKAAQDQGLTS